MIINLQQQQQKETSEELNFHYYNSIYLVMQIKQESL